MASITCLPAGGELVDEPRIDGAELQAAGLGLRLVVLAGVVEQPADLRAGEIGVDEEAGALADLGLEAAQAEILADVGGAAALPDDGVVDGAAGRAVPDNGSLALVGDADGGNVFRG